MSLKARLASQSSVIFGARIFGAGIIFILQALMARIWGADILGSYMLIIALSNIIMAFLPLGFQTIGTYFVAEYSTRKDALMLKSFLWRCYSHILFMSLFLLILIVFFGDFFKTELSPFYFPIAFLAISIAFLYVSIATLVGLKRPIAGFLSDALFRPILVMVSFVVAIIFFKGETAFLNMIWLMVISITGLAAFQFFLVLNTIKKIPNEVEKRAPEVKKWWRFAAPWVLIALATDYFFDIDLVILASYFSPSELAIFGVCAKMFALVSFGVAAVYAVSVPDMFESEANNDRAGFLRKVGEANLVASALALILLLGAAIGGRFALSLFGDEFTKGAVPLVILCVALLVRSIFGPASLVLSIYDRPYASLPSVFLGLISLLVFNYLLVPPFALIGAAIAALLAISVWSIAQWLTALKLAKVDISIFAPIKKYFLEKA